MMRRCALNSMVFQIVLSSVLFAGIYIEKEELFIRQKGKPVTEIRSFSVYNPNQQFSIKIHNGPDGYERVSSATVSILPNNEELFKPKNFNQQVEFLEDQLFLQSQNTLKVQLASKPASAFKITIYGIDDEPPSISIVSPEKNIITTLIERFTTLKVNKI